MQGAEGLKDREERTDAIQWAQQMSHNRLTNSRVIECSGHDAMLGIVIGLMADALL